MTFSETLWDDIAPIYRAIIEHPFIQELAGGTLRRDAFAFYMQQDALYLADFGRALAIMAGRSPTPELMLDFARFAEGDVLVERAVHGTFLALFDINSPITVPSPSCLLYKSFLLAVSTLGPYSEAVAALLPCFWIYREVGLHIHRQAAADNPYRRWIDTYAGEEFGQYVARAIAITDEVAATASDEERQAMRAAFVTASRLEWMFWDSAYRQEAWRP